jgi:hypothetical protein
MLRVPANVNDFRQLLVASFWFQIKAKLRAGNWQPETDTPFHS